MKNIKKFLLTIAMTMALGTSAFAASGFEFLLNVPFGMNVGIPKYTKGLVFVNEGNMPIGADVGIDAQIGYMFQVKENFGISALAELGYSYDIYGFDYNSSEYISMPISISGINVNVNANVNYLINCKQAYHSFKIGLLPKFNISVGSKGAIAIGIGGGVKIPGSGKVTITTTGDATVTSPIQTTMGFDDKREVAVKRKDITDTFSPSVIGYLKVTFDYYLFFTDNIAMNFGLYLGGAFGPDVKDLNIVSRISGFDFSPQLNDTKIGANAFDIGLQLGFRYGPKA